MKRVFFWLLFLEASFVLQGVLCHFPLISLRIDLPWLVVLYFGFFVPVFPGGFAVFLIGLAQESLGVPFHGALSLSYLLIYFLLRMIHQHLFFERGGSQLIWIVLLTLVQKGTELGLLLWQGYPVFFDPWHLFPSVLLTGFFSFLLFPFFQSRGTILWKRFRREQGVFQLRSGR